MASNSPQSEDDHTAQARLNGGETVYTADSTLTKRELFAAMAMQGFASIEFEGDTFFDSIGAAKASVEWADALLKELARG